MKIILDLTSTGLIAGQDDKLKGVYLLWVDNTFIVENQNIRIVAFHSGENQALFFMIYMDKQNFCFCS